MMQQEIKDLKYEVIEIEKTATPEGMAGDNWYRYVIRKGKSVMDCKKAGSLETVTEHAEHVAELINSRHVKGNKK
jgi:hypothetical protein